MNRTIRSTLLSLFIFLISCELVIAANYFSAATGNWNSATTWAVACGAAGGAGIPGGGDNVTICSGHTVSVTANASITNVTVNSSGTLKTGTSGGGANKTITVSGS